MKILSPNQKTNDTKVLIEENSILMKNGEKNEKGLKKTPMQAHKFNQCTKGFVCGFVSTFIIFICFGAAVYCVYFDGWQMEYQEELQELNYDYRDDSTPELDYYVNPIQDSDSDASPNDSNPETDYYGNPIQDSDSDESPNDSTPEVDYYGNPIHDSDSDESPNDSNPELDYYGNPIQDSDSDEYSNDPESDDDSVYIPMSSTPDQEKWETESGDWE